MQFIPGRHRLKSTGLPDIFVGSAHFDEDGDIWLHITGPGELRNTVLDQTGTPYDDELRRLGYRLITAEDET